MYAARLGAQMRNIHFLEYKRPLVAPFKYVLQTIMTLVTLFRERPSAVYVTNPPVFAALCVFVYAKLTGTKYAMDTHSPALYIPKWKWSVPLQRIAARGATLNVVDQERFKTLFESWGTRALILERPPKQIDRAALRQPAQDGSFDIAVVNTFAADEPLEPVLEAAKSLPNVRFLVTGDKGRARPGMIEHAPSNVVFTGYLRGDDYWNTLNASRAVLSYTTLPHSLLGGAQDGLALRKPLIMSRQPALQEYFTRATIFVDHTPASLIAAVSEVQSREAELVEEAERLAQERAETWNATFAELKHVLGVPS
jgi:hypothetical protein